MKSKFTITITPNNTHTFHIGKIGDKFYIKLIKDEGFVLEYNKSTNEFTTTHCIIILSDLQQIILDYCDFCDMIIEKLTILFTNIGKENILETHLGNNSSFNVIIKDLLWYQKIYGFNSKISDCIEDTQEFILSYIKNIDKVDEMHVFYLKV